ncbi:hypothetical protein BJY04DRAFT_178670 [Aspergillus karnatakaensis]|uniref:uncharacterized protein n=1 Tax=Aspergillus karnatakaensis TaxID=1810916 RepID=UPI003CCE1F4C
MVANGKGVLEDENGEPLPEERTSVSEEWEPEGRPRVGHYRVSEKHMKFASVMFNRFLEAQRPLKKVIIRGFDSEALLIVLSVIHGRFDKVPRKVTLELLARIYAVVEYLDCRDALSFCFDMWLPQIRKDMPYLRFSRDLTLWLWLSYELRLEDDWQTAATKVICQSPGPVSSLKLPFPSNVLGKNTSLGTFLRVTDSLQAS